MSNPKVLFICTNNAIRSQMAEAFLKKRAAGRFEVYSAGTEPKQIHPLTIRVMSEVGIDLSEQRPKDLREYLGKLMVRYAIFVCPRAEDKCPVTWPGALARLEWPFEDPAAQEGTEEERIARFRNVRDRIDERITAWLREVLVKRVVFVCVENSNRSQMAEAFARIHGAGKIEAYSAGSRPSGRVNPKAIEAMKELGYDLTTYTSKGLDTFNGKEVDVAVTMGCGDECPLVFAKQRVDWQIPDPKDMPPEQFREVRNLIETKVKELIQSL